MLSMNTLASVRIRGGKVFLNAQLSNSLGGGDAAQLYRAIGSNYPKFFKMDLLCKWAWLGTELLLRGDSGTWIYDGFDKARIGIALTTTDGCLEVDKRYAETLNTVPSPALFVYTLPNIMLGEICIRHGFTGEQRSTITESFDADELLYQAKDLLLNRGISHCLAGMVDAVGDSVDLCLFWLSSGEVAELSPEALQAVYDLS